MISIASTPLPEPFLSWLSLVKSREIVVTLLPHTKDIWCRDYMPVKSASGKFVQFALSKNYYLKKDEHKITDPASVCKAIRITTEKAIFRGKKIKLDGGNVIMGYRRVFITDKVYSHNLEHNVVTEQAELRKVLQNYLEVDQLIILPHEPYDFTAHADGMIRILDDKTVIVNDYNYPGSDRRFAEKFYNTVTKAGLRIELVPYTPVSSMKHDQPATGCYINYLQVNNKVFLPQSNDISNDKRAIYRFEELFGKNNIIPVDCAELAKLGGVLNCITWEL